MLLFDRIVEWTWTVLSFVGTLFSLWMLQESTEDYQALKWRGVRDARTVLARGNIRRHAIRVFSLFTFTLIGGFVLLDVNRDPLIRAIIRLSFVFVVCLMTWGSWSDHRDRRKVDQALRREYEG